MMEFHGWDMPLHYETGIMKEHLNVRKSVGIFDVSHMGDFIIIEKEKDAFQKLMTNNIKGPGPGKCVYTHMPDEKARIIDDLIVTRIGNGKYFCVPNASMIDTDRNWIVTTGDVNVIDLSSELTCLAVQGPNAKTLLLRVLGGDIEKVGKFQAAAFDYSAKSTVGLELITEENMKRNIGMVSGTGYTGEDGYEVIIPNAHAERIWDEIFSADVGFDVMPAGLGARDTLRLEMGFLLSGTDFNRDRTTIETNCAWVIKWDHEFVGKDILAKMKETKQHQKLLGIELEGRAPARTGSVVRLAESPDEIVGWVSSGNYSPSMKKGIALAYLDRPHIKKDIPVLLDYHGRQVEGTTVKTPFLKK